ncbi:MAG: 30S ribosomal protein S20 [Longicatena sp.]
MPQIQSQKKRVKTNNKRNLAVTAQKSALKTAIKAVLAAVEAKDSEAANNAYNTVSSKLDKAVAKGIHHRNYATRQKSRLARAVNTISAK